MNKIQGICGLQRCALALVCMVSTAGFAQTIVSGVVGSPAPQAGASQPQKPKVVKQVVRHSSSSSRSVNAKPVGQPARPVARPQPTPQVAQPQAVHPQPTAHPAPAKPVVAPAVSAAPAGPALPWYVYAASVMPDNAQAVKAPDGSARPFAGVNNTAHMRLDKGTLRVDTTTGTDSSYAKFTLPYAAGYPRHVTLVARIAGNSNDNRASDLEIALAPNAGAVGSRVKFIVSESGSKGLKIEKFDGQKSLTHEMTTSGVHVYQLAFTQNSATEGSFSVYVDGVPTPVFAESGIKLRPTNKPGENFIGIGANSTSQAYQGSIDWAVWTTDGAYTPAQLHGRLPGAVGSVKGY